MSVDKMKHQNFFMKFVLNRRTVQIEQSPRNFDFEVYFELSRIMLAWFNGFRDCLENTYKNGFCLNERNPFSFR